MKNFNHLQDSETGEAPKQTIFSYKIKAPFSVESFEQVRCYLLIKTEEGEWLWLCYLPIDVDAPMDLGDFWPIISSLVYPEWLRIVLFM